MLQWFRGVCCPHPRLYTIIGLLWPPWHFTYYKRIDYLNKILFLVSFQTFITRHNFKIPVFLKSSYLKSQHGCDIGLIIVEIIRYTGGAAWSIMVFTRSSVKICHLLQRLGWVDSGRQMCVCTWCVFFGWMKEWALLILQCIKFELFTTEFHLLLLLCE
jgi:hypothetical protein